jgi:predicted amidophosphoribosyltransferase
MENVSGAFALRSPEAMNGKRVLLIDDVFTTGATLNECSRVLKHAGAASVTAFTLARVGG